MGEPSHSFASGHIWSPVMRSSRGKLFVYFSVLGAMCFVVFLLSNAHSSLKQLEGANEKCQQQQDSLSAQLQVVYEHKNRLEKSLQQEKSDHKRSKEDIEKQLQEEESKVQQEKEKEQSLENQISQLKSLNAELEESKQAAESSHKEQLQSLQAEKDSEIKHLQEQITELLGEKEKLEHEKNTIGWKMKQYTNEATLCQAQFQQLNQKLNECTEKLKQHKEQDDTLDKQGFAQDNNKKEVSGASVTPPSVKDKVVSLDRPNVLKPIEHKSPDVNNENVQDKALSANLEMHKQNASALDVEKHQLPAPFNEQSNLKSDVKEKDLLDNEIHGDLQKRHDPDNFPQQVQPPVNNGAERGEYANAEQLEQPQFRGNGNDVKKEAVVDAPNINDVKDAQVHDMMVKSPDGADPRQMGAYNDLGNKMNYYRPLMKDRAELPGGDKHYGDEDDDDQDGENEDDPMGEIQGAPVKGFGDHDFDAQDAMENKEAVMVAPK